MKIFRKQISTRKTINGNTQPAAALVAYGAQLTEEHNMFHKKSIKEMELKIARSNVKYRVESQFLLTVGMPYSRFVGFA